MATKNSTNVANAVTVPAGGTKAAPAYISTVYDLSTGLGAAVNLRLINSATAPGTSNQPTSMTQVSADGTNNWVDHTPVPGSPDANGEANGVVELSWVHKYGRTIFYGSNQTSTATIDLVQVTAA